MESLWYKNNVRLYIEGEKITQQLLTLAPMNTSSDNIFNIDLVKALVSANVPFHKIERAWRHSWKSTPRQGNLKPDFHDQEYPPIQNSNIIMLRHLMFICTFICIFGNFSCTFICTIDLVYLHNFENSSNIVPNYSQQWQWMIVIWLSMPSLENFYCDLYQSRELWEPQVLIITKYWRNSILL